MEQAEMEEIVDSLRSNEDVVVRFKNGSVEGLKVLVELYLMYYLYYNAFIRTKLDNAFWFGYLGQEIEDKGFTVNTWRYFDGQAKMVWKEKLLPHLEAIETKKAPA